MKGNIILFAAGMVIGSIIACKIAEKKYERITQEEVESMKEAYARKENYVEVDQQDSDNKEKAEKAKEKPNIKNYASKLRGYGYKNHSGVEGNKEDEEAKDVEHPYVISPEEFGEFEEYEKISIIYYADQILADDNNELVEDVEHTVGFESLSHFGEFEDDSVFVRNDRLKCDYEILLDQRQYSEVIRNGPHRMGGL